MIDGRPESGIPKSTSLIEILVIRRFLQWLLLRSSASRDLTLLVTRASTAQFILALDYFCTLRNTVFDMLIFILSHDRNLTEMIFRVTRATML